MREWRKIFNDKYFLIGGIHVPFHDTSFEELGQSHWLTDPVHCRLHTSLLDAGRERGGKREGRGKR